jgi:FkbM family methyltransferase
MGGRLFSLSNRVVLYLSAHGLGRNGPLGRTWLVRTLWPKVDGLLFARLHPRVAQVQGHTMHLDAKDTLWLSRNGVHEPFETALVHKLVGTGQVALDIGANIGYYTLLLARQVGPEGRVVAFEPDPTNFGLLRRNVEANGYRNVDLVPKALASETRKLRLYLSDENKGDHRTFATASEDRPSVEVQAVRLDEHFAGKAPRIDFIKMDIQGAEPDALRGMQATIAAQRSLTMMVEFWPHGLRAAGREPRELLDALADLGFRLRVIDARREVVEPLDAEALLARLDRPGRFEDTNLLCERGP